MIFFNKKRVDFLFFSKRIYEKDIEQLNIGFCLNINEFRFLFVEETLSIYVVINGYNRCVFKVQLPESSDYSYVEDFIEYIKKYKEEIELAVVMASSNNNRRHYIEDFLRVHYKNYDVIVMMT